MSHVDPRAATASEWLNAVRLTRDPVRLHAAPAAEVARAAAACAKALVAVAGTTGPPEQRASAFHVIDRAERLLERELRRRESSKDH